MSTEETETEARSFLHSTLSAIFPDANARLTLIDSANPARTFTTARHDEIRSLNAILKFGREADGFVLLSLDTEETPIGFVMTFEPDENTAATVLPPSITLEHEDGRKALVYLLAGDAASIAALRRDLEPLDGERYVLGMMMPLPFGSWLLSEADEARIESGERFPVLDCTVAEQAFFPDGEDVSALSADSESENALLARIKEVLDGRKPNRIQRYALHLAYQGFYPIPVAGIVQDKETGKLECACQSFLRYKAEKDGLDTTNICGAPGKHPTANNWQARATRDPAEIMKLFAPEYNQRRSSFEKGINVGLLTAPRTGLAVLDIDGPEGIANLAMLVAEHGPLPDTIAAVTGSGGRHIYFRQPTGVTILNSASKIAPKVDFRGDRGQVLAPQSKHKSGGVYQWEEGRSPDDLPLAEMPHWLIRLAMDGSDKENASKPAKSTKKVHGKELHTGSSKATSGVVGGSDEVESGWHSYLAQVGDHEGGKGFDGPIWDAMLSFLRLHGHDADVTEFMQSLGAIVARADRSKADNRDRYLPDDQHIVAKLKLARQAIRDTPSSPVSLDESGNLKFGKSSPFCHTTRNGHRWFGDRKSDDGGSGTIAAICQAFRVVNVSSDTAGGGASISIEFDTAHNGTQEVTFSRSALFDRQEVPKLLAGKWFELLDAGDTLDLLKSLILPIDTLNVERTGWHGAAFLHPSGSTVRVPSGDDRTDKKLRLGGGAPVGDWRGGTLEGWKEAVAPAFGGDAHGREHFALGVLAGAAGIVAGFVGIAGFPILNLHGNTSRGKSTSLMLAASVSGAPNERGTYQSLRKTDNGMEAMLSARSGITVAFDEGKTTNAETLDNIIWMMAHGAGKTRGTVMNEARAGKEFCGFGMMANEIPLAQKMAQARNPQPGGFHARVFDIDVSIALELTGEEKDRFFAAVAGTKVHYGHAWEPVVCRLQVLGRERVESELNRLTKEVAGAGADAFTMRSARTLALVWYSGIIMQELRLIPGCNLERVAKWAWGTRAVESTLDPFTRAMETLLTELATRRGVDIIEWGNSEGRLYREPVAFTYIDKNQELLLVPRDRLADLCGGHMSGDMIRTQMVAQGLLVLSGKKDPKPRWSSLPDGQALSHYRIIISGLGKFAAQ